MRKRILAAVVVCTAAVLQAGCTLTAATDNPATEFVDAPAPQLSGEVLRERGGIVTATPIREWSAALDADADRGWTVTYRSVSGVDGSLRDVSGVVFVPTGEAPEGGWPVLSYGHGATGLDPSCGTSGHTDLLGYDLAVASLLQLGFVVAMTDFQGWGAGGGANAYLEPKTAAYNMIDAVRAARALVHEASATWYAVGASEGGHAAWAANEYAATYGDGLDFRGSASSAPMADLSGIVALAQSGWLSHEQQMWLPMVLAGLSNHRSELNAGDYLHGPLEHGESMWSACTGPHADQREQVLESLTARDTEPVSDAAAARLKQAFASIALPQRRASGPMLVITGAADQKVNVSWVRQAVRTACRNGGTIEFIVRPDEGHGTLVAGPQIGAWLLERLAGKPARNTC
ncbi:lipase family protein [Nocardia sp. JW2]|uniref:lipase family protein n=1 Tax=Nocardia sp. JW2 TaxID=3450738 RepID=UPI003F444E1C